MDFPGSSDPRLTGESVGYEDDPIMGLRGLRRSQSMRMTGVPITLIYNFQVRRFERSEESIPNSVISAGHNCNVPITF